MKSKVLSRVTDATLLKMFKQQNLNIRKNPNKKERYLLWKTMIQDEARLRGIYYEEIFG